MNVREAAKRLDEIEPNWFNKINFETLDMNSTQYCVLGQVFGSYKKGISSIGIDYFAYLSGETFGFKTNVQLWKDEVNERQILH